jgi:hypothetical protein
VRPVIGVRRPAEEPEVIGNRPCILYVVANRVPLQTANRGSLEGPLERGELQVGQPDGVQQEKL